MQAQGILANTDVIITSDHGEAFGEHGSIGHSFSMYLEEVAVPLVILSPAPPAGRVVENPVSLRDLPATVVDLLGLSATSPFQGRSLAAYWKPGASVDQQGTSPAFSERASETAFQIQPATGRAHPGFEMSVVDRGHHYIRNGAGVERLYDFRTDPFEQVNLAETPAGNGKLPVFRRKLLDVLSDGPGAVEVEKAYLADFRKRLEELVPQKSSHASAIGY